MIFSLFHSNKTVSQPNPSTTSDQPQTPKQPETTKSSSVQSNKISFRLSDRTLYDSITNHCRINNISISRFITDALRDKAQNLQLSVNQQAPVPIQQTAPHRQQQRVTVPAWLTKNADPPPPPPKADDPQEKLMEQWKREASQDQQRYEAQYEKDRKQRWLPQQPNRWRR
jgi:hypothetical protein